MPSLPPSSHLTRILTRAALPLVLPPSSLPFAASTLALASTSLPAPQTPPVPFSERTIHALYPSPPTADSTPSSEWSLKGFLIGNGGKRSRTRQELVALAQGRGTAAVRGEREKTGPAKALVEEWLREGRRRMKDTVQQSGKKGDAAYKIGVEDRLRFNATVGLNELPQLLALLSAPKSTYLNNPLELLPFPSPVPHLSHVAHIAQDLARSGGSEAQGTAWYTLRLRLSTIYTLSELRLLAPSTSDLPTEDRLADAVAFSRSLFKQTAAIGDKADDAAAYAEWVTKSWKGLALSRGF